MTDIHLDIVIFKTFGISKFVLLNYWQTILSNFDIDIVKPRYGSTLVPCGIQGMVVPFRFGAVSFQFLMHHIGLLHLLFIWRFILSTINIQNYSILLFWMIFTCCLTCVVMDSIVYNFFNMRVSIHAFSFSIMYNITQYDWHVHVDNKVPQKPARLTF